MAIRPEGLRIFAPAKLNLFLHVVGKRPDGFHDLQSLVVFADAGDVLTINAAPSLTLALAGPFGVALKSEPDNLVLRAARALAASRGIQDGASFKLEKHLPVASGIGGGSADAAAALRGLRVFWDLDNTSPDELQALAASLGSDIPVCLGSAPAFMEGRGEIVTALDPMPELALVLANPGVSVATPAVFRGLQIPLPAPKRAAPLRFATTDALLGYLQTTRNDLEAPARALAPVIDDVLAALSENGAQLARMSGSGATCFGIYATAGAAERAAVEIAKRHPGWWCRACGLARREDVAPVALA